MLKHGDTFPQFRLPDENGEIFDSSFLSGIRYIVFTFDCSESKIPEDFNDIYQKLMIRNIPAIGIGAGTVRDNRAFMDRHGIKMKILSDADRSFVTAIDSWNGGLVASTFIVGKDGKIEESWYGCNPENHVAEVYEKVKRL